MPTFEGFMEEFSALEHDVDERLPHLSDQASVDGFRVAFLGRKGRIAQLLKTLGELDDAGRREAGRLLNELKSRANKAVVSRETEMMSAQLARRLEDEFVDLSLPGVFGGLGHLHP